ncbi:hypothetical protein CHU98_g9507 [Xylaria longipes]|nr:hypothetical protein CHU98_g9507 [Xylaria longipes]
MLPKQSMKLPILSDPGCSQPSLTGLVCATARTLNPVKPSRGLSTYTIPGYGSGVDDPKTAFKGVAEVQKVTEQSQTWNMDISSAEPKKDDAEFICESQAVARNSRVPILGQTSCHAEGAWAGCATIDARRPVGPLAHTGRMYAVANNTRPTMAQRAETSALSEMAELAQVHRQFRSRRSEWPSERAPVSHLLRVLSSTAGRGPLLGAKT